MTLKKNLPGQKYQVFAFNVVTGRPIEGDSQNITATLRLDWGRAREMHCIHPVELGAGYYVFDLKQAETNAEVISLYPESTTPQIQCIACNPVVVTISPDLADGCARSSGMTKDAEEQLIRAMIACLDQPMPAIPGAGSPFDALTEIAEQTRNKYQAMT